ncbi:rod shape-determining protein MreC [Candidatus Nomurabacteria bacterium]|nr:rod shape-determining protein MreC [Candidatus Nomurabacteria bacterium]
MNYLLVKKQKLRRVLIVIVVTLFCAGIFVYYAPIARGLSWFGVTITRPLWSVRNTVANKTFLFKEHFRFKSSLIKENELLKSELAEKESFLADYASVLAENIKIKSLLGRTNTESTILGTILVKPNRSVYDTLILDIGSDDGVRVDTKVYVDGIIYVGDITSVTDKTARVTLLSTADKVTQVSIDGNDTTLDLVGNGGGSFEMNVPKGFELIEGVQVSSLGLRKHPIAIAEKVISDPREPIQKILLRSLVNIQEVRFVQVEK